LDLGTFSLQHREDQSWLKEEMLAVKGLDEIKHGMFPQVKRGSGDPDLERK